MTLRPPLPPRETARRNAMNARLTLSLALVAAGCAGHATPQATDAAPAADRPVELDPAIPIVLAGRITDESGRPIEGVKVQLYSGLATRWPGQGARTGPDGRYRFDPLETGAHTLDEAEHVWCWHTGITLEHPDYASPDGSTWWDVTTPIRARQRTTQDFIFARAGRIEGVIQDAEGFPAGDLDLRIMTEQEGRGCVYATTDHRGRFSTQGLAPGAYIIQWNAPMADYAELARVTVKPGEVTTLEQRVRFTATPEPPPPTRATR